MKAAAAGRGSFFPVICQTAPRMPHENAAYRELFQWERMSDPYRQHIQAQQVLVLDIRSDAVDHADADIADAVLRRSDARVVGGVEGGAVVTQPQDDSVILVH